MKRKMKSIITKDEALEAWNNPETKVLFEITFGTFENYWEECEKFNNMTLYVGKDIFGIFLPASVGIDGAMASFRYYIADKNAGTISIIGKDANGENSGVLLLLNMKGQVKTQMMKVYNKYN